MYRCNGSFSAVSGGRLDETLIGGDSFKTVHALPAISAKRYPHARNGLEGQERQSPYFEQNCCNGFLRVLFGGDGAKVGGVYGLVNWLS